MACSEAEGLTYYLEAGGTVKQIANTATLDVCTATKILDRLHREFTEQYVTSTAAPGRTLSSTSVNMNPTFYLRKQPNLNGFQEELTNTGDIYRLYNYLTRTDLSGIEQYSRSAVHAIMNGVYNSTIENSKYLNELNPARDLASNHANFKGIYGLNKLNEVLEQKINEKVKSISATSGGSKLLSDVQHYDIRQGVKTTLEEIARRENEIYREKFLNIILVVVGILLVSSQLTQKYFSLGGGGSGSGSGGFGFGNIFTGFGLGTGSGLFSRFGGLGLGRSGRSRWTSMFSNNPYALSTR
jgi:hypothetical protein